MLGRRRLFGTTNLAIAGGLMIVGLALASSVGLWRNRLLVEDQQRTFRLLAIADGSLAADQFPMSSLAIVHARRSIERRKAAAPALAPPVLPASPRA